jgi:hypothetical protein
VLRGEKSCSGYAVFITLVNQATFQAFGPMNNKKDPTKGKKPSKRENPTKEEERKKKIMIDKQEEKKKES